MHITSNINGDNKTTSYGDKLFYRESENDEYVQIKRAFYRESPNSNYTQVYLYDNVPPVLSVTSPASGNPSAPTVATAGTYTVRGTCTDSYSGVKSVTVNGIPATINGSNWTCNITIYTAQTTTVTVVATDYAENTSTVTRYVSGHINSSVIGSNSTSYGGNGNITSTSADSISRTNSGHNGLNYSDHASCQANITKNFAIPYGATSVSFSLSGTSMGDTSSSSWWRLYVGGSQVASGGGSATINVSAYRYRTDVSLVVWSQGESGNWVAPYSDWSFSASASISNLTVNY